MKKFYFLFFLTIFCKLSLAQYRYQDFDGGDTIPYYSLQINIDTADTIGVNCWQIGKPQKTLFYQSASAPNALITDSLNYYPANCQARFSFDVAPEPFGWGPIIAIQWIQKIDIGYFPDSVNSTDIGLIEYSIDSGNTWSNVFNDPYTYNFYGFSNENVDTLPSGEIGFAGQDTNWRNIWLCFDYNWLMTFNGSIRVRFTLQSDSIIKNKEGWLIDNFMVQTTMAHPVKSLELSKSINVFPNPSSKRVQIELKMRQEKEIIQKMELLTKDGKIIKSWSQLPGKFWFDTNEFENGNYFLNVETNFQKDSFPIVIQNE